MNKRIIYVVLDWLLVIVLATAATIIIFSTVARSHEHWINKGGYRGADGQQCCGEQDCYTIVNVDVTENNGGFHVRTTFIRLRNFSLTSYVDFIPYAEATPSEDREYHVCLKFQDGKPVRRCFFAPVGNF